MPWLIDGLYLECTSALYNFFIVFKFGAYKISRVFRGDNGNHTAHPAYSILNGFCLVEFIDLPVQAGDDSPRRVRRGYLLASPTFFPG